MAKARCSSWRIVLSVAFLSAARPAHAEDPPPAPARAPAPEARPTDPLRPTGLILAGAGTSLAVLGGVVLATSTDGDEFCGLTGCATRPDFGQRNEGAGLLGAGLGLVWVGGLAAVAGSLDRRPPTRSSPRLMTTGVVLTGFGVAFAASAAAIGWANGKDLAGATGAAVLLSVGGGIIAMIGVPFWMAGSQPALPADRSMRRRSPRAAAGGITLAVVGVGALMGASLVAGTLDHDDPGVSRTMGVVLAAHGVLLLGGASMLWDHGSTLTPTRPSVVTGASSSGPGPEIAIGPITSVRWRF